MVIRASSWCCSLMPFSLNGTRWSLGVGGGFVDRLGGAVWQVFTDIANLPLVISFGGRRSIPSNYSAVMG